MGSRPKIWPMRQYSRIITQIICEEREKIYREGVGAMQCKYSRNFFSSFFYKGNRSAKCEESGRY